MVLKVLKKNFFLRTKIKQQQRITLAVYGVISKFLFPISKGKDLLKSSTLSINDSNKFNKFIRRNIAFSYACGEVYKYNSNLTQMLLKSIFLLD